MGDEKKGIIELEKYRQEINVWYAANNIIREKSELYHDFLLSLTNLIDKTYLGSDIITSQSDMINHFKWCLNKVLDNFEHEKIIFSPSSIITYDFLWYFFYKGFYISESKEKYFLLTTYFSYLFDHYNIKTPDELESFYNFYKILNQNLKKMN